MSQKAVWDPVNQIYVDGVVPENARVQELIDANHGALRIFGYGSLCWNPGSMTTAKSQLGRVYGYRRCWAQKSTDHRGTPRFPGIVCTLLKDEEFRGFRTTESESITEGMLYEIPPEDVDDLLAELDFREKGGYARDIIEVVEDASGDVVKALLYRGTADNPAIWPRALRDLTYAAAVMTVAVGPSGANGEYLQQLDDFLERTSPELKQSDDTFQLAELANRIRDDLHPYFLYGCGSNQHNQLLLASETNAASLIDEDECHELREMLLLSEKVGDSRDRAQAILAGGGHSGVLTEQGRLVLFGWDGDGQLGTSCSQESLSDGYSVMKALEGVQVSHCSLGFSHTLAVEAGSDKLLAFGDNSYHQLGIRGSVKGNVHPLNDERVIGIAAGVFHSVAVTALRELVYLGKSRHGPINGSDSIQRWKCDVPLSNLVTCGRQHTVVVDEKQRLWTFGDNKYHQLGRSSSERVGLVDWDAGDISQVVEIHSGWSHTVVLARTKDDTTVCYGWGRNDKGQLGTGTTKHITTPLRLFEEVDCIQTISCGSESTVVVDSNNQIWSCGWNEHGNLGLGHTNDAHRLAKVTGAPVCAPPGYPEDTTVSIAAGGGHLLAMYTVK